MSDRRILTEQEAWNLLAFLISCAETGTHEPHHYGPRRLVDAASHLLEAMIASSSGNERAWLEGYRREIDSKKIWATSDWESFSTFIKAVAADLARQVKARETAKVEPPASPQSGGSDE